MNIVEITITVDKSGSLILPQTLTYDMKLNAGDEVNIAYITHDSDTLENTYREFLVSHDGIMEFDESITENSFTLPYKLMDAAGIPADSDVIIECGEGMITISADASD